MRKIRSFSSSELIVLVSLFVALFGNATFFSNAFKTYTFTSQNILFLGSLLIFLIITIILILSLLCHYRLIKPVLIVFLLISAATAYFMDQYGAIIDSAVVTSMTKTDTRELLDLFSLKMVAYIFFLGLLPSMLIYKIKLNYPGHIKETISRLKLSFVTLALGGFIFFSLWSHYASFFRIHQDISSYANPVFSFYSVGKLVHKALISVPMPFKTVGADATLQETDIDRELVIMVVGETARADHFSLNGYHRETNPKLKQRNVINFPNVWSCGTLTIDSVPCMFSNLTRASFGRREAKNQDNVLDILQRSGINVLWRDNNSSSKGVADRVLYQSFLTKETNPVCDVECRDEGMLSGLQEYINQHPEGDIMIVLHQMGNHGPAYYKRYPRVFEKFTPVCKTNELSACTSEEISNTYDNAILYTDHFLSRVIDFLKQNDRGFETAMVYMSDHGESLGDKGIYLHGLPYVIAPDEQKHVPAVMWFGKNYEDEVLANLESRRKQKLSHDNLFSTLLGMFEIKSKEYNPSMDILDHSHENQ